MEETYEELRARVRREIKEKLGIDTDDKLRKSNRLREAYFKGDIIWIYIDLPEYQELYFVKLDIRSLTRLDALIYLVDCKKILAVV